MRKAIIVLLLAGCGHGKSLVLDISKVDDETAQRAYREAAAFINAATCNFIRFADGDRDDVDYVLGTIDDCSKRYGRCGPGFVVIPGEKCGIRYWIVLQVAIHELIHAAGVKDWHSHRPDSIMWSGAGGPARKLYLDELYPLLNNYCTADDSSYLGGITLGRIDVHKWNVEGVAVPEFDTGGS